MLCSDCKEDKLSNEFANFQLSDACNHPLFICLRCAHKAYRKDRMCPYNNCESEIGEDQIEECKYILNQMFPEVCSYTQSADDGNSETSQNLTIRMMTGEQLYVKYSNDITVVDLKKIIKEETGFDLKQQKITHGDKELQEYKPAQNVSPTLQDYEIVPRSILQLEILLYNIPMIYNDVSFEITWRYPNSTKNHLDATCFIFRGTTLENVICYENRHKGGKLEKLKLPWYKEVFKWTGLITTTRETTAVQHTGHFDKKGLGCQIIHVQLKNLKPHVTHIFFALSARDCPTISKFDDTRLELYETSHPKKNLCVTELDYAKNSPSIVICYLAREGDSNMWQLFRSGILSGGNDDELKKTILDTIDKWF